MSKEDEKQLKLTEVYNQLTVIKNELHALMRSPFQKVDHEPSIKIDCESIRNKEEMQKTQRKMPEKFIFQKDKIKQIEAKKINFEKNCRPVHMKDLNSPRRGTSNDQLEPKSTDKKSLENTVLKISPKNGIKSQPKFKEELKFMSKLKFFPQSQNFKVKGNNSSERSGTLANKKFTHGRHATQYEMPKQPKVSPPHHKIHTEQGKISEKSVCDKKAFLFNKSPEIPKFKSKKLKRMCSDFTGLKKQPDQNGIKDSQGSYRVRQLKEELKKKDETIIFLTFELQEIDKSFRLLQTNLKSLLGRHANFKGKLTDIEVNETLRELMVEMDSERIQLETLHHQCQRLRQVKKDQDVVIQALKQKFSDFQKTIGEFQKTHFEDYLTKLSSKLELAVIENRMKDQFIVNFLTLRNKAQPQPSEWMASVLQKYLTTCGYPSNRLYDKLTQEEAEIQRLKEMLMER